MATSAPDAILLAESTVSADTSGKRDLNLAAGATIAIAVITLLLAAIWGPSLSNGLNPKRNTRIASRRPSVFHLE